MTTDREWWFSPRHEIVYGGCFLVEPGELFRFKMQYLNDNLMAALGQVIPYKKKDFRGWPKRRCDDCGKVFVTRKYLYLHRIQGCNRKPHEVIYYELLFEDLGIPPRGFV